MPYMDPNKRGDKDWSGAHLNRQGGPGPMRRDSDGMGAVAQAREQPQPRTRMGQIYPEVAADWDRAQATGDPLTMAGANIRGSLALGYAGLRDAGDATLQGTVQGADLATRPVRKFAAALTGREPGQAADWQVPQMPSRTPRQPAAPTAAPTPAETPASATEAARQPPPAGFTGPTIPGGGRPTSVPGIFQREGPEGRENVPEFYNLRPDGTAPSPLQRGSFSVVESLGTGPSARTSQALSEAKFRAARDGDWRSLERIGAIDSRGPAGAVGAPRVGTDDMFSRSDDLMQRANDLYNRADRARSLTERSRYLKQARAMMGMAENAQGGAVTMAGHQAGMDTEAMRQQGALQKALMGQGGEGLTDVDRANIAKTLADAGFSEARAMEIYNTLMQPGPQGLAALDFDPRMLEALMPVLGRELTGELAQNEVNRVRQAEALQVLRSIGPPQEVLAAYRAGELADSPAIVQALRDAGYLGEGMAMGGLVSGMLGREPMSYAEGGLVDDPMMDPMLMDMGGADMGGDMGALDMAGFSDDLGMAGMAGPDPMMQDYEQYAAVAEQMGLPVIPFEQFAQIMMQAQEQAAPADMPMEGGAPGAVGYARGGPVDAGGKMVIDPDPNAPTDSIPAMIDGQRPAELDSGEFVIPAHAVMFHGLDKLNKLIAQADQHGAGQG